MVTDGCLYSDGRHLNLTSNDVQLLETFKRCLKLKNKISWKPSGYTGKLSSQVQFGDVGLYRWFVSIGITPRKTKTVGVIDVPDKYFFDYLRGDFDGDGNSHAYWDSRWRSSVSLYINFTCASRKHLEWINETVTRLLDCSGTIHHKDTVFSLRFAKQKARLLYNKMYYSESIPHLFRKKEKLNRQWAEAEKSSQGQAPATLIKGGSILTIT